MFRNVIKDKNQQLCKGSDNVKSSKRMELKKEKERELRQK